MLKIIATTLAIVAVDTAENGPSKVRQVTNTVCRNLGPRHLEPPVDALEQPGHAPEPSGGYDGNHVDLALQGRLLDRSNGAALDMRER